MARLLARDWLSDGASALIERQRMSLPPCAVVNTMTDGPSSLFLDVFAERAGLSAGQFLLFISVSCSHPASAVMMLSHLITL
jgi:hypothetical protein